MKNLISKLNVNKNLLLIYVTVYFICGMIMHNIGDYFQIARFTYWWQVITCYICYMVPVSLIIRDKHWLDQYAYGVVAIAFLEFFGYTLETSIAFDNNILDYYFGVRNFSLSMTIFFGAYFPLGNKVVSFLNNMIFTKATQEV